VNWRGSRSASRNRYLDKYDEQEVDRYDAWIVQLTQEDDLACLADIQGFSSSKQEWRFLMSPGGTIVVLDGLFDRSSWNGKWEEEVDTFPISACQTTALTPYLLESVGFHIEAVEWMEATNKMPATRTKRYMVVASKPK